ncbi:DUF5956 family protein [Streptomyces rhizosphaericus]|uniref:Uncharacterized protein n=1 Tax=Streptomyces rhizosphaericus TaxID=114699 RepID=A0A6G4AJ70_9ACTN|nr:DUF5956 family protein [Streptomyces rhizosphaericus]NEW73292.1 hypothetical protein [Streptomyces rhizosphaericus]
MDSSARETSLWHDDVMDWGWDQEPHPLARRRADNADIEADRLPEVIALHEQGWYSDLGGGWDFLPCLWPSEHRAWVPNRSTHYAWEQCIDHSAGPRGAEQPRRPIRWTPALLAEQEEEANAELEDIGVPTPRPAGRIWFLRPFAGFTSVEDMLGHLNQTARSAGVQPMLSERFVALVAEELRRLAA